MIEILHIFFKKIVVSFYIYVQLNFLILYMYCNTNEAVTASTNCFVFKSCRLLKIIDINFNNKKKGILLTKVNFGHNFMYVIENSHIFKLIFLVVSFYIYVHAIL